MTIVDACLRDGRGGSPTVVLPETGLSDEERRAIPEQLRTSHAVFVDIGETEVALRFFTSTGELPSCGHGTVAALAYLADRFGDRDFQLRTRDRSFLGRADSGRYLFDAGQVQLREPASGECDGVLAALGATPVAGLCVASVGRERLLVPVATPVVLAGLTPDLDRLRYACDHLGLLGCYVYCQSPPGRYAARMFAPSIGVPEDIANANSTSCLAAYLADRSGGDVTLTVDMGDALGVPAAIDALAERTATGPRVWTGGAAVVR
ncbi:MAG: PhzF family phenazine biosynthesis protein [Hamadaea sp.]|uniref:PhzF family phenazine biosynthesis protein n=1 Tax=Hamadaea sp. TaxID=2024425 RepID=UPI0017DE3D32|nr:PhzF family phenazine biosynthesis protein [Hamadaea sp.]NUR74425.1 PhzF family phenazine biosynthesis protein [Hamadaea sp.]NUT22923.1 PhzF family phenazine biosynthesis protein [Hamadaea sp.]